MSDANCSSFLLSVCLVLATLMMAKMIVKLLECLFLMREVRLECPVLEFLYTLR